MNKTITLYRSDFKELTADGVQAEIFEYILGNLGFTSDEIDELDEIDIIVEKTVPQAQ